MPDVFLGNFWKRGFLLDPCRGVIRQTIGATKSVLAAKKSGRRKEFCIEVCEERT
jgi:hypothetical protein